MGLDINGTQFMLYAKTLGVDFTRTATIGRQGLHLSLSDLRGNLQRFGFSFADSSIERMFDGPHPYSEDFLRSLGAEEVHSVDFSDYEGATHVHNMNIPIPEPMKRQYSIVLDGGSLEHIFNFPVAMKNCMEMVRVGGHFLGIAPANNFMGHGFYQFSPEMFFSIFAPSNGYELEQLIAFEDAPDAPWYLVSNPAMLRTRVTLTNSRPVYLLSVAKRVRDIEPFQSMPQQSDYVAAWTPGDGSVNPSAEASDGTRAGRSAASALARRYTPRSIKRAARRLIGHLQPMFDPRFFKALVRTDGAPSPDKALRRTS
jgi:hypothetical protein